ncbi:MAG: hypothetical protein H7Z74_09475 [Anaerolineae bacterium]|nr:hypothetical protein [Gemmatimonadaceae bacterium]
MPFDLGNVTLADRLRCAVDISRATRQSHSLEEAANAVVRYLYQHSAPAPDGRTGCALVRCYVTRPFGALDAKARAFAAAILGDASPVENMNCLTLLATVGDEPAWNSRLESRSHGTIPLQSEQAVERAPMIAQLIKQFGLQIADVVNPSLDLLHELAGKSYNVFHVERALGSPYVPAQEDFVIPYGIESVLGFGGSLANGDLFAVILFSRLRIPEKSANRFRALALDVKAAFFPFREALFA